MKMNTGNDELLVALKEKVDIDFFRQKQKMDRKHQALNVPDSGEHLSEIGLLKVEAENKKRILEAKFTREAIPKSSVVNDTKSYWFDHSDTYQSFNIRRGNGSVGTLDFYTQRKSSLQLDIFNLLFNELQSSKSIEVALNKGIFLHKLSQVRPGTGEMSLENALKAIMKKIKAKGLKNNIHLSLGHSVIIFSLSTVA